MCFFITRRKQKEKIDFFFFGGFEVINYISKSFLEIYMKFGQS